jgi:predicted RNase H-like nuclease (RuvC/YqgF family)
MSSDEVYCPECGTNLKERWNAKLVALILIGILGVSIAVLLVQHRWSTALQSHVDELNVAVAVLKQEKAALEEKVQGQGLEIEDLKDQVRGLKEELSNYKLNRPTMSELRAFLAADDLDIREWVRNIYDCDQFSRDLRIRAREAGWNFSIVSIEFSDPRGEYGHACNGVILENGEFVYVEPQTDQIYYDVESLIKDLYEANGWYYGYSVKIVSEVVFW